MKNLLSKTLLCGVLATSFVLINCQKAPARKVTPDPNALHKPGPLAKSGPCTPAAITAYDAAKAALEALKVNAAKPNPNATELSAELKAAKTSIDAAKDSIAKSTKEGDADECTIENKEDPKKPAKRSAADFTEAYTKVANFIKGIGGTPPPPPATALKTGDKLELSQAAAALFTTPANGCVSGGELKTTTQCTELTANPEATLCNFKGDGQEVKEKAKADVLTVESKDEGARKIVTINVLIKAPEALAGEEAAGDRAMSIECSIAGSVKANDKAAEAATAALGATVTKVENKDQATQVEPPAGKQEEAKPEASKPASDTLVTDVQGALNLLDSKAAGQ